MFQLRPKPADSFTGRLVRRGASWNAAAQNKGKAGLVFARLMILVLLVAAGCSAPSSSSLNPPSRQIDCLARAMYFESHRSSRDGLIAVGHVVMNRVQSPQYPNTICAVVAQKNQFAPGVMTRPMTERTAPMVRAAAQSVYAGERHPLVGDAMFFHAATYRANFNNMHYVVTAGGNAFYERRRPEQVTNPRPLPPTEGLTPI
jgi:spore germination cell wall hydrolase CwlJ-like protein